LKKKSLMSISGLSRNVIILGVVSLLNDSSSEMIYPLLPIFLTVTLGATAEMLGLIEGIAESTAALLKLFSGYISDRFARRKIFAVWGYGLSALTRSLIALAAAGWHVLLVRFGDRIGKGIRTAPRDALIADSIDSSQRGKAFGFHRAMDHAGAVIGPLLAMVVLALSSDNYRLVFWLAVIPALASVIVLLAGAKELKPTKTSAAPLLRWNVFDANFKKYLLAVFVFTLGNSSDAFLLLRAKDMGVTPVLIPALWLFHHVVKMLASVPGAGVSDRLGRKKIIYLGWLLYALVYLGFGLASRSWHIWILFAVYSLYYGLTEGTEKAFVADLVSPEKRGTAYGVYNFSIAIGALPASVIMGALWHRWTPLAAFGFGVTMAFAATLMLVRVKESSIPTSST
jgi:MFS family permease